MEKAKKDSIKLWRVLLWGGLEVLTAASLVFTAVRGDVMKVLMCVFTMGLLCLPFLAMKCFGLEMHSAFFVFCELYAIGPMCGHVYNLYYYTTWWDGLLHTAGGVVFAIFGVFLAKFLDKEHEPSLAMKAIFALCFSMALSVAWEFVEYGCDQIFGTDMQNDTVVSDIHSYLLGGETAKTGSIEDIEEVYIDGQPLGLGGYLDIGLHDTMQDMLVESLGAAVYTVFYAIDKEKHPILYKVGKEE